MTRQAQSDNFNPVPLKFQLPDADLSLWLSFLNATEATQLQQQLAAELDWQQDSIMMFGKKVAIPRTQVWMGDPHCAYRYSGTLFHPQVWHPKVQQLAHHVSQFLGQTFNAVLLNRYSDGQQHMGWHADNEPELGLKPQIASVSLGQPRRFDIKHRQLDSQLQLTLQHGSLLLMAGDCQRFWLHRLPKQARCNEERINLTFRYITRRVGII